MLRERITYFPLLRAWDVASKIDFWAYHTREIDKVEKFREPERI